MRLDLRGGAGLSVLMLAWYVRHGVVVADAGHEPPSVAAWSAYLGGVGLFVALLGWAVAFLGGRGPRVAAPIAAGVLGALVYVDTWSYGTFGVHALSPAVLAAAGNDGAARELALPVPFLVVTAVVAVGAAALAAWLRRPVATGRRQLWLLTVPGAATVALVTGLHTARAATDQHLLAALPLPGWLTDGPRVSLDETRVELGPAELVRGERPSAPGAHELPHLVLIVAESLRADLLRPDALPRLHALSRSPRCVHSSRHVSGGHTTEYGVFTLLYALDPWHLPPLRRDGARSQPLEALRGLGYRLEGVSASALRRWNGAGFLVDGFDHYEEHLETGGWEDDDRVRRRALEVLRSATQPTLLFVFLNGTHHNYQYPPRHERHLPVIDPGYDHFLSDDALRRDGDRIRNRYLNAALWVDEVAAEIAAATPQPGWVFVTGDHGEEFWEHGLLGHAAPRFVRERTDVPLVVCGMDVATPALSSHVDIMPTILGRLGVASEAWASGSLLGTANVALVGGLDFPYGNPTMAVATSTATHWVSRCRDAPLPCLESLRSVSLDDRTPAPPLPDLRAIAQRISRYGVGAQP